MDVATSQLIYLVRHPESEKNLNNSFASLDGTESVTDFGELQVADIVATFDRIAPQNSMSAHVVSANSARSISCANALAAAMGVVVRIDDRLTSIRSGEIAGLAEIDVAEKFASYHRELEMYRRGVLNSYDIDHPGERLIDFEERVSLAIGAVTGVADGAPAIVVAHKSTITATLIAFSRRYHGYPVDFFGFVDIPLGSISLVELAGDSSGVRAVGLPPSSFSEVCL